MTGEERRFKVIKIDKYNSQILVEEGKIENKFLGVLVTSILAIELLANPTTFTSSDVMSYIKSGLGGLGVWGSLTFLKRQLTSNHASYRRI